MKKTWIKVKRGLLETKHRHGLGIRIWLYLYMLDQTDWDTGKVLEWRDGDAASELNMSVATIRKQRRQLDGAGYITCSQGYRKQVIVIHNYTNPRKYDGEMLNHGDHNLLPLDHGDLNGVHNGDLNGIEQLDTPSYKPQITNHIPEKKSRKLDASLDHPAIIAYRDEVHLHVPINLRDDVVSVVDDADKWRDIVHDWMGKGWNKQNISGMLDVYKNGWSSKNGKKKVVDMSAFDRRRAREES